MSQKQKPITTHSYIRNLDTNEVIDFEKLTKEEKKEMAQKLNEQAARTIVIDLSEIYTTA